MSELDVKFDQIPPEIIEAANKVSVYMKKNYHADWEFMDLAERALVAQLRQSIAEKDGEIERLRWLAYIPNKANDDLTEQTFKVSFDECFDNYVETLAERDTARAEDISDVAGDVEIHANNSKSLIEETPPSPALAQVREALEKLCSCLTQKSLLRCPAVKSGILPDSCEDGEPFVGFCSVCASEILICQNQERVLEKGLSRPACRNCLLAIDAGLSALALMGGDKV